MSSGVARDFSLPEAEELGERPLDVGCKEVWGWDPQRWAIFAIFQ